MLRRLIETGTIAGMVASTLVGCSWPQWGTRPSPSSSAMASRSLNLPVATQSRTSEVPVTGGSSRHTSGFRAPHTSNQSLPGGGVEIEAGTPTNADGARGAAMPDEMAASLLETATVLELRGNLEAARQQYERALSIVPNDVKLLVSFARFADRHGQGTVAADLYQRVLESESSNPLLWSEAGLSLSRNGRGEAGLAACRKAVAAAPENQRYLANLSEAQTAARHFDNGEKRLADSHANLPRGTDRESTERAATPAMPVSAPSTGQPQVASREGSNRPFSPGSTARQFERPLPPVPSSRRFPQGLDADKRSLTGDAAALPTEGGADAATAPSAPVNTKDFVPADQ